MTTPNPTPATAMPSTQFGGAPSAQPAQPVSTEPPAPPSQAQPVTPPAAPQQPNPPAPQQNPPAGPPPATGDKPPEGDSWREYARLWESRAKGKGWDDLQEKAQKWEQAEAANRTQAENDRIERERIQEENRSLKEAVAREKVARETGVLPELLGGGTEEQMRAAAQKALEWRGEATPQTPPPPATAAVPASEVTSSDKLGHAPNQVQQLTLEQFKALDPAKRMEAVRAGQCANIGIGQPKPGRRMGNQLEVSATSAGESHPGLAGPQPVVP